MNQSSPLNPDFPAAETRTGSPPAEGTVMLTIPVIVIAALVDGINPCAFAVLTFLLITIMAQQSRRNVISVGAVYIFAVFVFYFFSGLGLFGLIQISGMSRVFSLVAAAIALIAGVLMLRDAFREGKPLLAIPESKKGIIDRFVIKSTLPAAFVLGVLVGIFELPCTGGIYLAILSLLSGSMTLSAGIPFLLIYNVFFVVPLVIVLGLVYWGLPPERFMTFQSKHRMAVRICMASLMIGIAGYLLFTVFG